MQLRVCRHSDLLHISAYCKYNHFIWNDQTVRTKFPLNSLLAGMCHHDGRWNHRFDTQWFWFLIFISMRLKHQVGNFAAYKGLGQSMTT